MITIYTMCRMMHMTPSHYVLLWDLIFCLIHYIQTTENTLAT